MENFIDQLVSVLQTLLIYAFNGYYVSVVFLLGNLWIVLMLVAFAVILLVIRRDTNPPV